MKRRLTARELEGLMAEGACVVVDVRAGWEWAGGRIAGSRHVPVKALPGEIGDSECGELVVLVCKSGYRSQRAVGMLRERGFSQVTDLAGGIDAWKADGLDLERDPAGAGSVSSSAGRLRVAAGLLVVAGWVASGWWPPAIYVSALGVLAMLCGWLVTPPRAAGGMDGPPSASSDSSETACSVGGG